jgi:hypothetical protein
MSFGNSRLTAERFTPFATARTHQPRAEHGAAVASCGPDGPDRKHQHRDGHSTFSLMLEAQARGHTLHHYEVRHMSLREGGKRQGERREDRLYARARRVTVQRVQGAPSRP